MVVAVARPRYEQQVRRGVASGASAVFMERSLRGESRAAGEDTGGASVTPLAALRSRVGLGSWLVTTAPRPPCLRGGRGAAAVGDFSEEGTSALSCRALKCKGAAGGSHEPRRFRERGRA